MTLLVKSNDCSVCVCSDFLSFPELMVTTSSLSRLLLESVVVLVLFIATLSAKVLINDIKLRYPCCNKLPMIIFILMHGDDDVINVSSIRLRVRR